MAKNFEIKNRDITELEYYTCYKKRHYRNKYQLKKPKILIRTVMTSMPLALTNIKTFLIIKNL